MGVIIIGFHSGFFFFFFFFFFGTGLKTRFPSDGVLLGKHVSRGQKKKSLWVSCREGGMNECGAG
jgi:hypothetical protein